MSACALLMSKITNLLVCCMKAYVISAILPLSSIPPCDLMKWVVSLVFPCPPCSSVTQMMVRSLGSAVVIAMTDCCQGLAIKSVSGSASPSASAFCMAAMPDQYLMYMPGMVVAICFLEAPDATNSDKLSRSLR